MTYATQQSKDYRNGGHLDPYENAFLATQLQTASLKRLREKIGLQRCAREVAPLIHSTLLKYTPITDMHIRDRQSNFHSYVIQALYDLTYKPPTVSLTLDPESEMEWNGVPHHDLVCESIANMTKHRSLVPIWLLMTHRAIVQGSASTFPGLSHNISLAGLAMVLHSLGVQYE